MDIEGSCVKKLSNKPKLEDSHATKQVVALLSAPLEKYSDNGTNKVMAMVIIQSIMTNHAYVSSADKLDDFNEEQNSVSRVIHVLYNDDPEEMLKVNKPILDYFDCEKAYHAGGPKRLPFTIPPLVFSALRLVWQLQNQDGDVAGEEDPATPKKIFQLLNQTVEALSYVTAPELALRLYLQCAEAANDYDLEPVAYEFFTQAFVLYEEENADSKAQVTAIHLIIGTLQRTHVFGVENRDTLTDT
ncbi:hypothetical protein LXL04_010073 [Taraxacum kok-saghyz]